jgi:Beta-lactamase enzyme family
MRTSVLAATLAAVAVGLAGCGTSSSSDAVPTYPPVSSTATPSPAPAPAPAPATPTTDPLAAPAGSPTSTSTPAPAPAPKKVVDPLAAAGARARKITDKTKDWASFTLLDRRTGKVVGDSRSAQVTFTESTVKAWLAADLLATRARQGTGPTAYETARMTAMIRESDDNAAEVIWRWLGADGAIDDMIKTCRLQDTRVYHDWWSKTEISARDLARLGDCIVPGTGKFLSPQVGAPLVRLMRSVEASNAFGIQQAQPAGKGVRIAVKNGWTEHGASGQWNVNCLGIWGPANRWVLAVTTRYPIGNGLGYGADVCRRVTAALFPLVRTG